MTENNSDYKQEYYKGKRRVGKLMIFLAFLLALGIILIFAFYDKWDIPGITGNSVKIPSEENSVAISLQTNIPELEFNLENANFSVGVFSNVDFDLDDKIISPDRPQNSISFEGFTGKLKLDNETIITLNGKISRIILEGVPITAKEESRMKIYLVNSKTKYSSIEIKSDSYLKELNFIGSGTINLKENNINLLDDRIVLKNLFGKFLFKEEKLSFNGIATKLDIGGKDKRFSISK